MHTPETCSTMGCHEPGAEVAEFHTCTCPTPSLYEQLMELAIKWDHAADDISPPDLSCTYGCEDVAYDEVQELIDHAWEKHGVKDYHVERDLDDENLEAATWRQAADQIKAILNASKNADTEGSASSQHFIETGVRLPADFELGIEAQVWRSDLDNVPVVQIDTTSAVGRMRVNLNDGPIWDGDPEKGNDL